MKKIIMSLALVGSLFAGDTIVPPNEKYKINTTDIWYLYNFPAKKCEPTTFKERTEIIASVRSENAIITEKYINDAGTTYLINYEYKGTEHRSALMNNYGECRLFEDIMIKGLDVKSANYVDLKQK